MSKAIVFTLTGPDHVGIVEEVTERFLELGGNVETSRMARLGGEFTMLMLVTLPDATQQGLDAALESLSAHGYRVSASETQGAVVGVMPGWLPYRIQVDGADHEGIVHGIARGLSRQGINIESMDTATTRAPVSGTPLFAMTALVLVPPDLAKSDWIATLKEAADRMNVDVTVTLADRE